MAGSPYKSSTTGRAGQGVVRTFFSLLPGNRAGFLLAGLAELGLLVPGLLIPAFTRIFVDDILVAGKNHWLAPLLGAMLAAMAARMFLIWLQQTVLAAMEARFALVKSAQLFFHLLRLPLAFFSGWIAGELSARVDLSNQVAKLVSKEMAGLALRLLLAFCYGAAMVAYSPLLGAVAAGAGLASLLLVLLSSRIRLALNRTYLRRREQLVGMSMAGAQHIVTIKAMAAEQDFFGRWAAYQTEAKNAMNRLERWIRILDPAPRLLSDLSVAAIIGLGALQVMAGDLTMGEVAAIFTLQAAFFSPMLDVVQFFAAFQTTGGYLDQLDEMLEQDLDPRFNQPKPELKGNKSTIVRLQGRLDLEQVAFGYDPSRPPVVDSFSLSLAPGARVALVGPTGSGKTTVARLAAGLYQPWSGRILFDGRPESTIDPDVMNLSRRSVSQSPYLFEGTVYENISMWNASLDEASIIDAAKDACIHQVIAARSGGYESPVAEAGANFSGGQRQRLEIARALASNPSLLILDEATSALDPGLEKQIDENLRRRGVTCLIIAHRLSTIRDCDEILVLDHGRIVERGRHQELFDRNGVYTRLVEQ